MRFSACVLFEDFLSIRTRKSHKVPHFLLLFQGLFSHLRQRLSQTLSLSLSRPSKGCCSCLRVSVVGQTHRLPGGENEKRMGWDGGWRAISLDCIFKRLSYYTSYRLPACLTIYIYVLQCLRTRPNGRKKRKDTLCATKMQYKRFNG